MKHFLYLTAGPLVALGGCCLFLPTESYTFSFENDMEGWQAKATDVDDPPVEWSIEHTEEMAKDGSASVKLFLNNLNDKGKIWFERGFELKPNTLYRVTVDFAFATAVFGQMNLWRIIAGVLPDPPQTADDLIYQGDTGNGSDSDVGYKWLQKSYTFDVTSSPDGMLYVFIGVWGTWEVGRTYYIDNVRVSFSEF